MNLTAGHWYRITGQLVWADLNVSGQFDLAGGSVTDTGASGALSIVSYADGSTLFSQIVGLATVGGNGGDDTGASAAFDFTMQVNGGGTLIPRFAQLTTNANASTLLKYSTITAQDVTP